MKLTHFNEHGDVSMVDVSHKEETKRTATARGFVRMPPEVIAELPHNKKGDPLQVARIAGIMAAKKTADLIPLCHSLPLSHVAIEFTLAADGAEITGVEITATASTKAPTGVEMEALTAVAVAALTIYDMTKALSKSIEIQRIMLLEKTGGKSGDYRLHSE